MRFLAVGASALGGWGGWLGVGGVLGCGGYWTNGGVLWDPSCVFSEKRRLLIAFMEQKTTVVNGEKSMQGITVSNESGKKIELSLETVSNVLAASGDPGLLRPLLKQWLETASSDPNSPQLHRLNGQKIFSTNINSACEEGCILSLKAATVMLQTPRTDWGISREKLFSSIVEGIQNLRTEKLLQQNEEEVASKVTYLPMFNNVSRSAEGPQEQVPDNGLMALDGSLLKLLCTLNPSKIVARLQDYRLLSDGVDKLLGSTQFFDPTGQEESNVVYLVPPEEMIHTFLREWIHESKNDDGTISELCALPRQREVTDIIISLCRTGTPQGRECAMLVADLLTECDLIRDHGEVSKNAKWLLTALSEYVSSLDEEQLRPNPPLPILA